jgi:hypothetical protein
VSTAPFDHGAWVERACRFVEELARLPGAEVRATNVASPASQADLNAIETELGLTLTDSLRELFALGAGGLDCHYVFEPDDGALGKLLPHEKRIFGGARLGPLSELPDFSRAAAEWAAETWVAETPDQQAIWRSALPFARMDNGDYLALDRRGAEPDPPVVYLNHDDDSSIVAPSLVAFLNAWERLAYVGPEHWLLLEFTDTRGHLDPGSDRAADLRRLFAAIRE